jgi:hypothetical protein
VLLNYLLDDGQPESGALGLGGDVGLEQPIHQFGGDAAAVVLDADSTDGVSSSEGKWV